MSAERVETSSTGKRTDYLPWENYFMGTALLAAKRSKDPHTQVGACIVNKKDIIISSGYNGFPRGCSDDTFSWGKGNDPTKSLKNKHMYVVHAEVNAILNSNHADLAETRLYTTLFPCNECAKLIIQSDIKKVFYLSMKSGDIYEASKLMFDAAGIKYELFNQNQDDITIKFKDSEN